VGGTPGRATWAGGVRATVVEVTAVAVEVALADQPEAVGLVVGEKAAAVRAVAVVKVVVARAAAVARVAAPCTQAWSTRR
jgi:hypothetical protein